MKADQKIRDITKIGVMRREYLRSKRGNLTNQEIMELGEQEMLPNRGNWTIWMK